MCNVLYLASDQPLRVVPWDPNTRAFHSVAPEGREEVVAKHFSKRHVHYLGSHLQCGCGYFYPDRNPDGSIEPDELEEWEEVRTTRERLVEYLRGTIQQSGPVEVLLSWSGDEAKPTERVPELTPEAFLAEAFPLRDNQLVVVNAGRP
jgi:hypothetical protein